MGWTRLGDVTQGVLAMLAEGTAGRMDPAAKSREERTQRLTSGAFLGPRPTERLKWREGRHQVPKLSDRQRR